MKGEGCTPVWLGCVSDVAAIEEEKTPDDVQAEPAAPLRARSRCFRSG